MEEEGSKHFANAYEKGFWEGLFYLEMEAGYFNFIANFLTAISSLIAIEFSPIITVYGSLFFVLLPIYCLPIPYVKEPPEKVAILTRLLLLLFFSLILNPL